MSTELEANRRSRGAGLCSRLNYGANTRPERSLLLRSLQCLAMMPKDGNQGRLDESWTGLDR